MPCAVLCWICRAWQAEKEALRQRRVQQEAAARDREAKAKAAAVAARAEEHRKRVEERKAKYVSYLSVCEGGDIKQHNTATGPMLHC